MVNKPTIAILAIIIVVVLGAGIYAVSTQLSSNSQSNDEETSTNTQENSQNDTGETMISAEEAQEIAGQYIEEPGATAGTPKLEDQDGEKIYVVPVLMNGSVVGQIEIDAYTGKNVGGAGGAP